MNLSAAIKDKMIFTNEHLHWIYNQLVRLSVGYATYKYMFRGFIHVFLLRLKTASLLFDVIVLVFIAIVHKDATYSMPLL